MKNLEPLAGSCNAHAATIAPQAAFVAVVAPDHGPLSPCVLIHRAV